MKQIIDYKPVTGVNTRAVLRRLRPQDQAWLKTVMQCYQALAEIEPRREFKIWFNEPNPKLPRQPRHNNRYNSAASFAQGIIEKLNQPRNRTDLSPQQCQGIERLSEFISECYDLGECPSIEFREQGTVPKNSTAYGKIFKA